MNKIIVDVKGTVGVGKSTVEYLIYEYLTSLGFVTNLSPDPDYANQNDFVRKISKNLPDKINIIKQKTEIEISGTQLPREFISRD